MTRFFYINQELSNSTAFFLTPLGNHKGGIKLHLVNKKLFLLCYIFSVSEKTFSETFLPHYQDSKLFHIFQMDLVPLNWEIQVPRLCQFLMLATVLGPSN